MTKIAKQASRRWKLLAIASVMLPPHQVSSFSPSSRSLTPSSRHHAAVSVEAVADDYFHADLKMALTKETSFDDITVQRRRKPLLIKGDVDGAEKAMRMLRHMIRIGVATEYSFQLVFESLLKRGRMQWLVNGDHTCAANEMEILLMELEGVVDEVSIETYNMVLAAIANCSNSRGNYRYAEKAEALLESLGDYASAESVVHVIRAWAWQQGNRDDATCARRALHHLTALEERTDDPVILSQAYDWVLEGFSKAVGGAAQANAVFNKRTQMSIPTPMADYTNVILAWTKSAEESSITKATELLESMTNLFLSDKLLEDPELMAYTSVISSWTALDRPAKAEELLWLLELKVRPKAKSIQSNVYTFNNVCHGYIKYNSKITAESVKSIEQIVTYMEENCKEQPLIKPDSYTYNTLIKAWNLSGQLQTVEQIEEVLDRMELVFNVGKVSNKNFNTVLNTYAKSKDSEAAVKALRLLERMKASELVDVDTISYTTVMECLSKCRNAEFAVSKSLELLTEIRSLYEETKDPSIMPNSRTFAMAISTLTKAPDRVAEARDLLDQLMELYRVTKNPTLRPLAQAYNHVINCAANLEHGDRVEAFKIAAKTYQELREHKELKPDSYTYAFWFKACNQLLPAESALYEKFMNLSFSQCRKEGMVSPQVLNRLRMGHLSYQKLGEMLKCDPLDVMELTVDDMNPSWTRNVRS